MSDQDEKEILEESVEPDEAVEQEQEKVNWEEPSVEQVEGEEGDVEPGVQVGLTPFGPMIQVTGPDGKPAQKVISQEDCYLLAGQLLGLGNFVMSMQFQAQMQEQAKLQAMMQENSGKRTPGGVYLG